MCAWDKHRKALNWSAYFNENAKQTMPGVGGVKDAKVLDSDRLDELEAMR
jgi:hypothetical protein